MGQNLLKVAEVGRLFSGPACIVCLSEISFIVFRRSTTD